MQARNPQSRSDRHGVREQPSKLLLVRDGRLAKNDPASALPGMQPLYAESLLEGLGRLESGVIDLVVLGAEFREEERILFLLDAQRRGFGGPILHVVSAGSPATRSNRTSEQQGRPALALPSLSAKEQAVLERVTGGWTNLQIARDLQCSEGSVKAIVQQLFGKFSVRKRSHIIRLAFERGVSAAPLPLHRSGKK